MNEEKDWNGIEKENMQDWFGNKGVTFSQLNNKDFSGIAESLCWTESACKMRLLRILHDGLGREEKEGLINMWSKIDPDPDVKILAEFSLKQSCNMEGNTNCFIINLNKGRSAIHIMQIAPNKLALFE